MNKFLFFDVDGTLVNAMNVVPDSAWKAIEECRRNGDYAFIASGRNRPSAEGFTGPEMDGTIFCTGAGIATKDHGTLYFPIPKKQAREMADKAIARGAAVMVFTEQCAYAEEKARENMIRFGAGYGNHSPEETLQIYGVKKLEEYRDEEVLKLDLFFPDEESCAEFVERDLDESSVFSRMSPVNVRPGELVYGEVNPKGISKGSAVREILKLYGGRIEDSYGFGDSMNDAEMMKTCGKGIAMGNGAEELKKTADYVTAPLTEDGIAKALLFFGLIHE